MNNRNSRLRPSSFFDRNDFFFYLQITTMILTKFRVNRHFGSWEEAKNRFSSSWRPSWISDRNNFSCFLSTSHTDVSYQVSRQLSFGSGEEAKNRFSRRPPWRPSWISDWTDLRSFFIYKSPWWYLPRFQVQEKKRKIDFQDGLCHGGHLGFPIETILAIFDLHVTPMLPIKFRVNWPFSIGKSSVKYIFKMAAMAAILDFRLEQF